MNTKYNNTPTQYSRDYSVQRIQEPVESGTTSCMKYVYYRQLSRRRSRDPPPKKFAPQIRQKFSI